MTDRPIQPRRSLIFAPGTRPDMFPKALKTGADIVTVDLEDAVAPALKPEARDKTIAMFADRSATDIPEGVEAVVRINCLRTADGMKDVIAVVDSPNPPPALMMTKVCSADEVLILDDALEEAGHATRLHVIIETNDGLNACYDIAQCSDRVDSLLFGGVDISAELRADQTWENLLYARSRVVNAAAGAKLDLIDVPWLDLEQPAGMTEEARRSKSLGFTGKAAIHPKQIAELNTIFSPQPDEVAKAKEIIQAFEESDTGLVVINGKLIERPVVRSMYRIVAIAEQISARG
jgi:citrate lyase beta subunit